MPQIVGPYPKIESIGNTGVHYFGYFGGPGSAFLEFGPRPYTSENFGRAPQKKASLTQELLEIFAFSKAFGPSYSKS